MSALFYLTREIACMRSWASFGAHQLCGGRLHAFPREWQELRLLTPVLCRKDRPDSLEMQICEKLLCTETPDQYGALRVVNMVLPTLRFSR
ncbi:hypothetical protein MRS76_14185 [Rhizobiaceae bacterium n13]|uniref:Uncharacterized protein n=1 Tax=Ferirhizobium litorale TaxID=2927786 RepID=A0AAE3U306_9HYPH|nr:hypothetical protein [Fererhizobium litorale]MDI7863106.1 hypothetical protein [Fererhizobium litorale]MDI7923217.1 hypothetical protein [Fererhizobium litorale]